MPYLALWRAVAIGVALPELVGRRPSRALWPSLVSVSLTQVGLAYCLSASGHVRRGLIQLVGEGAAGHYVIADDLHLPFWPFDSAFAGRPDNGFDAG